MFFLRPNRSCLHKNNFQVPLKITTQLYHLLVKNQDIYFVLRYFLHCYEINTFDFVQLTQEYQQYFHFCRFLIYRPRFQNDFLFFTLVSLTSFSKGWKVSTIFE